MFLTLGGEGVAGCPLLMSGITIIARSKFGDESVGRPGITELSRLTSDSVVYGGPQGRNPHLLRM